MEKRYLIEENELKALVRLRALRDILIDMPVEYEGKEEEYIDLCITDFGCRDLDEAIDKLIVEFGYEEVEDGQNEE